MAFNYVRCACGSALVIDRILVTQGDKPMIQVGTADICPNCRKVVKVRTSGGHSLAVTQYQLERAYRVGVNMFTLRELTGATAPKIAPKVEQLPKSDYNPNKFTEPEYHEEPF